MEGSFTVQWVDPDWVKSIFAIFEEREEEWGARLYCEWVGALA